MSVRRHRSLISVAAATFALALCAATASAGAAEQPGNAPVASSPPAASSTPPTPATVPASERQLSNDRTLTTWAHPEEAAPIYAHADAHSRRVGRMHLETEDGFPEVYLLLALRTTAEGAEWIQLRIPGRPNGRVGWVQREALGALHQTKWRIDISLTRHHLVLYYDGRPRFTAPVGVGKPSSPTPPGKFWIRERFRLTNRSNPYWPYALGTSDYSTLTDWPGGGVVGIHGDFGQPELIPGAPSHGCVRMRDPDIAWLAPRITLGTPVDIHF